MRFQETLLIGLLWTSAALQAQDQAARLKTAREHLGADRYNDAAAVYEELCPRAGSPDCWNELGIVYMSLGGYTRALESFERARALAPESGTYLSHLALAAFAARRPDRAGQYHLQALAKEPENNDIRVNYGIYLIMAKKLFEAGAEFERVLRADPRNFFACLQLGRVRYLEGRFAEALAILDRGIGLNDQFFELYYTRALVKARTGDTGGALTDLGRAEKLSPLNGKTGPLRDQIKRKINR